MVNLGQKHTYLFLSARHAEYGSNTHYLVAAGIGLQINLDIHVNEWDTSLAYMMDSSREIHDHATSLSEKPVFFGERIDIQQNVSMISVGSAQVSVDDAKVMQ